MPARAALSVPKEERMRVTCVLGSKLFEFRVSNIGRIIVSWMWKMTLAEGTQKKTHREHSFGSSGLQPERDEISGWVGAEKDDTTCNMQFSTKKGVRALHFLGACHRLPAVDCLRFALHLTGFPPMSTCDGVCLGHFLVLIGR